MKKMMNDQEPIKIEMFYTLTCPNCKILKRLLDDVLPAYADKFTLKITLANMPVGMVRTMKLGIHSVPTLLINDKIIFREVPSKQDLIKTLNTY
jgi:predicted DsbA family dithiol-disulfide isomerase